MFQFGLKDIQDGHEGLISLLPKIAIAIGKKRWLIVSITLFGALLGFLLAARTTAVYEAEIEVSFNNSVPSNPTVETKIDYLLSNSNKIIAVKKLQLERDPFFQDQDNGSREIENTALLKLSRSLSISRNENSSIVTLRFRHFLPRRATEIAEKYLEIVETQTPFGQHEKKLASANSKFIEIHAEYSSAIQSGADSNIAKYDRELRSIRSELATLKASVPPKTFEIMGNATVGPFPVEPKFLEMVLFGAGICFLISLVIVWGVTVYDTRVESPDQVDAKLGLPILGVIPHFQRFHTVFEQLYPNQPLREASESALLTLLPALERHLANKSAENEGATFSEGDEVAVASSHATVMHITSTGPDEGKTTLCLALATCLASRLKRVLIVDADLRKPSFIGNEVGLTDLLVSKKSALDAVKNSSEHLNVSLLSSGPIPPNSVELLSSSRFRQIIDELRPYYDFIIIDSPPMIGLADAVHISLVADATIFAVGSKQYRAAFILSARTRIERAGASVLGYILTKYKQSHGGVGYGYYYYAYGSSATYYGEKKGKASLLSPKSRRRNKIQLFKNED